jgi:DNA recombination protein RmuC
MGEHLAKVGTSLGGAVTAYNRAIGSLEARVLVSARRLADLGVSADELPTPEQIEVAPRALQAPELVDSEYEALLDDRPY